MSSVVKTNAVFSCACFFREKNIHNLCPFFAFSSLWEGVRLLKSSCLASRDLFTRIMNPILRLLCIVHVKQFFLLKDKVCDNINDLGRDLSKMHNENTLITQILNMLHSTVSSLRIYTVFKKSRLMSHDG